MHFGSINLKVIYLLPMNSSFNSSFEHIKMNDSVKKAESRQRHDITFSNFSLQYQTTHRTIYSYQIINRDIDRSY